MHFEYILGWLAILVVFFLFQDADGDDDDTDGSMMVPINIKKSLSYNKGGVAPPFFYGEHELPPVSFSPEGYCICKTTSVH